MKRSAFMIFLSVVFLCVICAVDSSAESWYVKREKNNKQPSLDAGMSYIEKSGGYYVDRNADENDKVIYLTFDAGYENGNVERILDVLKNHNAKGAFFVLENLIKKNTDLVKRMADEGHLVCNHTARHRDMTKISDFDSFKSELESLENIYREYTGLELSKYYRPPEGKFNRQNLEFAEKMGYKTIFWSCAYADWDNSKQPDREYALKKIKDNTHNGMIILLHPTSETNADILDELLTFWENEGYRFGTLDELTEEK